MKREAIQLTEFPVTQPREVCAVTLEDDETMSLATVYCGLFSQSATVVNVALVAGLMGHRQVIAVAGIPPGFNGIAVTATGIVADGFHVEVLGGARDSRMNVALGVRRCCSGHAVFVEPRLQQLVVEDADNIVAMRPFGQMEGLYRAVTAGDAVLEACDRVIHLAVVRTLAGTGSVTGFPGGATLNVPAGTGIIEMFPRGNLCGPRTLVFAGVANRLVEIVR